MAISFELNAELRDDTGKGASRRLRHAGRVPAIMYGGGKDPEALSLSHNEVLRNLEHEAFYSHILTIKSGGAETQAILRDLQRHPSKPVVMHMDLQRISATEKLKTHAPIHFIGEDVAPGVKAGGLVSHDLTEVSIECLPKDLPEFIEVDVSGLDIGESIHLSGLNIPEGVTLIDLARGDDYDSSVVSVYAKRVVEEEVEPTAEGEQAAEGDEEAKDSGEGESS
jgi:large subunit ribosomal protein L25